MLQNQIKIRTYVLSKTHNRKSSVFSALRFNRISMYLFKKKYLASLQHRRHANILFKGSLRKSSLTSIFIQSSSVRQNLPFIKSENSKLPLFYKRNVGITHKSDLQHNHLASLRFSCHISSEFSIHKYSCRFLRATESSNIKTLR